MSVSIHVQINRPMSLGDVARAAAVALSQLLNLRRPIAVTANVEEDSSGGGEEKCLRDESPLVICSVPQAEEAVRVMSFKVPVCEQLVTGQWVETGERLLASIQPHRSRSAFCWALTAAVAVGIARASSYEIEDGASFFTTACDGLDPEAFVSTLAVVGTQDDLRTASDVFYDRLNKSAEITRWVKDGCPQR